MWLAKQVSIVVPASQSTRPSPPKGPRELAALGLGVNDLPSSVVAEIRTSLSRTRANVRVRASDATQRPLESGVWTLALALALASTLMWFGSHGLVPSGSMNQGPGDDNATVPLSSPATDRTGASQMPAGEHVGRHSVMLDSVELKTREGAKSEPSAPTPPQVIRALALVAAALSSSWGPLILRN
ncbi:hypothetical protein B0T24DRAFT_669352 [Lasiosphaeria ovina]|uniref:Uncharacterized protein n=1 Tax=Lasiosphaeria ovina TaxID=92902 RepID=A0AAE0JYX6_9PEZI|nr:hypothetical protein B0T24DRAFT_669352 [Lasiosphaeria ovina]